MGRNKKSPGNSNPSLSREGTHQELLQLVLIFCEGEKTEVNYLRPLVRQLIDAGKISKMSDVRHGSNTDPYGVLQNLLEYYRRNFQSGRSENDILWIVIDRDEATAQTNGGGHTDKNFGDAISEAKEKHVEAAWSNPCFEYWFALHFQYLQSYMERATMRDTLNTYMTDARCGEYTKERTDMYETLKDRQSFAIDNAEKMTKTNSQKAPAECKPGTAVHLLIQKLNGLLEPDVVSSTSHVCSPTV